MLTEKASTGAREPAQNITVQPNIIQKYIRTFKVRASDGLETFIIYIKYPVPETIDMMTTCVNLLILKNGTIDVSQSAECLMK